MKTGELRPANYNPRRITDDQLKMLGKSMREFGDLSGIVVNRRTGNVVGGHQRLKCLDPDWEIVAELLTDQTGTVQAGHIETPYGRLIYREVDWPEKKEKLANIAANKHGGEWDFPALKDLVADLDDGATDMELTGFNENELQDLFGFEKPPADAEPQMDKAEELNKKWGVKPGDLWLIGDHRLSCGDSTKAEDVKRVMGKAVPLLMVTDPPCGVKYDPNWRNEADRENGKPYGARAVGKVTNDERSKWSAVYALSSVGIAYIWHAGIYAANVSLGLEAAGFEVRCQIIWSKKRFAISRGAYHVAHEPCFYAVKKGSPGKFKGGRKQSTLWGNIIDQWGPKDESIYAVMVDHETVYAFPASLTTVWEIKNDKACGGGHSTQKPLECMARPIRNHDSEFVYDPFLGSGTTMVACQNLKRKCIAIEISENYCAVILTRMADAFPGIKIERINNGD